MFKYPSPWQVLCSSLEKREQIQSRLEDHWPYGAVYQTVKVPVTEENLLANESTFSQIELQKANRQELPEITSSDLQVINITKYQIIGSQEQANNEVIDEAVISPETQAGDKTELHATETQENKLTGTSEFIFNQKDDKFSLDQERLSTAEEQVTKTVPLSAMDRVTRSLIFSLSSARSTDTLCEEPELETNLALEDSQTAEGKNKSRDVWVPSPDRERKLTLLKEENRFGIRAYLPDISPTKLFSEGEDDEGQPLSREFTSEKVMELEKQRRDIIKKQGQRKSLDTEELWTYQDTMDTSVSDIDRIGLDNHSIQEDVDSEQINFEAARKQFVLLEKKNSSILLSPRLQSKPSLLTSQSFYENDLNSQKQKVGSSIGVEAEMRTQQMELPDVQAGRERSSSQLRKQFFWEMSMDDRDSATDDQSSEVNEVVHLQEIPQQPNKITNLIGETPIEREIRLALEREESLRKERGIQGNRETKEMVEILKNPVLSQSSDTQAQKKSKERSRSSFFLQREIEKEAQREADLKSEGKVAGLYDKGNAQELDERRKLFEQQDEIPVQPQKGATNKFSRAATVDLGTSDNVAQVDPAQTFEKISWTVLGAPEPYTPRTNFKPAPLNNSQYRRQSADNILDYRPAPESSTAERQVLHKENFQIQPWKFRLTMREDEEVMQIQKLTEKSQENRDTNPVEIYKTTRLRPSASNVIEQEIQQTLERDRELQEQRRKSEVPHVTTYTDGRTMSPVNGYNLHEKTSLNSGGSSRWSSALQRGSSCNLVPTHSASPIQMFRPKRYPKFVISESDSDRFKRPGEEYWYAGIDPSDDVNTEIVESTRVNRHKNTMALRWEAGLYANEPRD
ncbi:mitotic interactor and substrate of PLK1 [Pelodytes ibericus]